MSPRVRTTTADNQLDIFAVAATLEAAPAERPAVILENWRRRGSFVVEAVEQQMPVEGQDAPAIVHAERLLIEGAEGPEPATEIPVRHHARLIALCRIRDAARRVLHAELANAPEFQVAELRQALNDVYDAFVAKFGPINLESVNARSIRRPNLLYFDGDPDMPLVSALELVDMEQQSYTKAPIFSRSVIRPTPEPVTAENASDALAISLDRKGCVDVPFMSALLGKPEGQVLEELAGVVYLNPDTTRYETAAEYLSGSVRHKLRAATAAAGKDKRFLANVEALKVVQPKDLTQHDIVPALGAPWIPPEDIRDFIAHLMNAKPDAIEVGVNNRTASWAVRVKDGRIRTSARAKKTWGTDRMCALDIVQAALNQGEPVVSDRIEDNPPKYRKNDDATLSVREKLQDIRDEFAKWLWTNPQRTVRLVTAYNELYNDSVERVHDGSHLTLPGASQAIELRPHQKDAIARALYGGNTLLAHVVGAGKTWAEAAIAMESKRLGLAKKPCLIIPNHLVDQFTRDFMLLYPTARLLVATKEDMGPQQRAEFIARVATSDVDCVIMTHSNFAKIPMSPAFERQLIQEEIAILERAVEGESEEDRQARRRALERWQRRLASVGQREDQDQGVTFEETGIDQIIVDEAHLFKSLPIDSKNRGLATKGSKRAEDLYLRTRYINRRTPNRNVVFATGTPITNSIAEVYTIQQFLQRDLMVAKGLLHFDAWAAMFAEAVTAFEIAPGGGFRLATRLARFKNVPELETMFRLVADVKLAKDLNLPVPKIRGGAPNDIVVQPTPLQAAYLGGILERVDKIKKREVKVHEDNMLLVVTDGCKVALDARMIDPTLPEEPGSKLWVAAERIAERHHRTAPQRLTQLVFCDIGTPKNEGEGFNVYEDLRQKLIGRGVAAEEIAFVHDAKTEKAKLRLYKRVSMGQIRILIGSTSTMGTGMNVQERLCAISHLDATWRSCDMEQRDGRGLRQGNMNDELEIDRYATERSPDAYRYQTLERKSTFTHQFLSGSSARRTIEEEDALSISYSTMKSICTGDPLVKEKHELEVEAIRLQRLLKNERSQVWNARLELAKLPDRIDSVSHRRRMAERDLAKRTETAGDLFAFVTADGETITNRKKAGSALMHALGRTERDAMFHGEANIVAGELGGFSIAFDKVRTMSMKMLVLGQGTYEADIPFDQRSEMGLVQRAEHMIKNLDKTFEFLDGEAVRLANEEVHLRSFLEKPSQIEEQLNTVVARLAEVDKALGITEADAQAIAAGAGEEVTIDDAGVRGGVPQARDAQPAAPARRGQGNRDRMRRRLEQAVEEVAAEEREDELAEELARLDEQPELQHIAIDEPPVGPEAAPEGARPEPQVPVVEPGPVNVAGNRPPAAPPVAPQPGQVNNLREQARQRAARAANLAQMFRNGRGL